MVHQVAPLSPDALIVADLGLLRILHEFFPEIPVHVSTQAGCASAESAEEFARMGASRVILERHLRMDEVARIAARSPIGVEIFAHGSLCYSYSGKCFFSSFLGGKSGNRGECVQPCRRLYDARRRGGRRGLLHPGPVAPPAPPGDRAAGDRRPEDRGADARAGIRPRRGVRVPRRARRHPRGEARGGRRGGDADPVGGHRPGDDARDDRRGRPCAKWRRAAVRGTWATSWGPWTASRSGWAFVPGAAPVSPGDRLRIQFAGDGSGRGFSAAAPDMRADEGGLSLKVPFSVSPGDLLFRTAGGGRPELTRRARREMEAIRPDGARFVVSVSPGEVAVRASYGSVEREYSYRVSGPKGAPAGSAPKDGERQLAAAYKGELPLAEVRLEYLGGPCAWGDVRSLFLQAARNFDKEFHLAGKRLRLEILPTLRVTGNRPEGPGTVIFANCRVDQLPHPAEGPGDRARGGGYPVAAAGPLPGDQGREGGGVLPAVRAAARIGRRVPAPDRHGRGGQGAHPVGPAGRRALPLFRAVPPSPPGDPRERSLPVRLQHGGALRPVAAGRGPDDPPGGGHHGGAAGRGKVPLRAGDRGGLRPRPADGLAPAARLGGAGRGGGEPPRRAVPRGGGRARVGRLLPGAVLRFRVAARDALGGDPGLLRRSQGARPRRRSRRSCRPCWTTGRSRGPPRSTSTGGTSDVAPSTASGTSGSSRTSTRGRPPSASACSSTPASRTGWARSTTATRRWTTSRRSGSGGSPSPPR